MIKNYVIDNNKLYKLFLYMLVSWIRLVSRNDFGIKYQGKMNGKSHSSLIGHILFRGLKIAYIELNRWIEDLQGGAMRLPNI